MKIAAIIPVYNRKAITIECLRRLKQVYVAGYELSVIVVDDASTDGTADEIKSQFPDVSVLHGCGDLWWTGAINVGVREALKKGYDYILLLNDDIKWDCDFLEKIVEVSSLNPNALISAIKLEKTGGEDPVILTGCFREVGRFNEIRDVLGGKKYHLAIAENFIECDALTGAALLIPKKVFQCIGLFDDKKFPHNWGDIEFTHRARKAGFSCLVASGSKIYTESNSNYHKNYIQTASRYDYVCNLIRSNNKFNYGLVQMMRRAFMHRDWFSGSILYLRYLISALSKVVVKVLLPKSMLYRYVKWRLN